jgi:hypothetical protein
LARSYRGDLGMKLDPKDFDAFVKLEAEIQHVVFGTDKKRQRTYLRWFLADRLNLFRGLKAKAVPIFKIRGRLT